MKGRIWMHRGVGQVSPSQIPAEAITEESGLGWDSSSSDSNCCLLGQEPLGSVSFFFIGISACSGQFWFLEKSQNPNFYVKSFDFKTLANKVLIKSTGSTFQDQGTTMCNRMPKWNYFRPRTVQKVPTKAKCYMLDQPDRKTSWVENGISDITDSPPPVHI